MSERSENHEEPRVVVTDKRKIDPTTGRLRDTLRDAFGAGPRLDASGNNPFADTIAPGDPAQASQPLKVTENSVKAAELEAAQQQSAERLADLQRVTAEYANYRKRVDRDRLAEAQRAKAQVVGELLTVLDDVDRADKHGDLNGAFKAVADKLTAVLGKTGLVQFGTPGDAFDPAQHEAVHFDTSPTVSVQVVTEVLRHGYTFGDRLIRPAVVTVTGPSLESADPAGGSAGSGGPGGISPDGSELGEASGPRSESAGESASSETAGSENDPAATTGESGGPGGVSPDGTATT